VRLYSKNKSTDFYGFLFFFTLCPSIRNASAFCRDFEFDCNAEILPEAAPAAPMADVAAPAKRLSKSQQRKLRRLEEERQRKQDRAKTVATLAQHQLSPAQLGLLRSISTQGQRETKKQALRRALGMQRAGMSAPEGSRLVQEGRSPQESEDDSEDDEEDDMQESSGSEEEAPAVASGRPGRATGSAPSNAPTAKRQKLGNAPEAPPTVDIASQARALREEAQRARHELGLDGDNNEEDSDSKLLPLRQPSAVPASGPPRIVHISRPPAIEASRSSLPIVGMEQEIMEAIASSDVVVLCGETGCGKTTQVPQFLLEAGYGCAAFPERCGGVGVTQPRRVAAAAAAARVAEELGESLGSTVGYQIRYDRRIGERTAIKFMTDGILLREAQEDFLLRKYSALVVDEAHERSLNTDILLGGSFH
jgi:ATP-dependent RNA helicase DHX37/DHR1